MALDSLAIGHVTWFRLLSGVNVCIAWLYAECTRVREVYAVVYAVYSARGLSDIEQFM